MIDTIILNIPKKEFEIKEPDIFTPPARNLDYRPSFYTKFVSNPSALDKKQGIYRPRLTINKRGSDIILKVEFSIPKLIFGNNLQEVDESMFDEIIKILAKKLWEGGIGISLQTLKNAEVRAFHPAKNIPINGGYSAMGVIKELSKINLTEKMDLNKTNFRNDGHSLQYYAKSHSLVFYDKNKDLQKPESRAIDYDQKIQQMSLFSYLENERKPEILRMEVRLSSKQKMNSVLENVGFSKKPKFQDVFKNEVCRKILKYYFNNYIASSLFIFDLQNKPQNQLKNIFQNDNSISAKQAIYLIGLKTLCQDKGTRSLRKIVEQRYSVRTWQRMSKDLKELNELTEIGQTHTYIKEISDNLEQFKPFKVETDNQKVTKTAENLLKYH